MRQPLKYLHSKVFSSAITLRFNAVDVIDIISDALRKEPDFTTASTISYVLKNTHLIAPLNIDPVQYDNRYQGRFEMKSGEFETAPNTPPCIFIISMAWS